MRQRSPEHDQAMRALLARLVRGDPTAPADLAEAYLEPLTQTLRAKYPAIAADTCATAAEDALLALFKNPHSYDPARGLSLDAYLRMSASRDLLNAWQSEQRHRRRRADLDAVVLSTHDGKYLQDMESDPARVWERVETVRARVPAAAAGLSEQEEAVRMLMDNGERKTEAYAQVLGIAHLPLSEQRRIVKRTKDRLTKRRVRAAESSDT